jgi:hypothetical protein
VTTMRERCKQAIMRSEAWSSFFDDEAAGVFAHAVLDELMTPSDDMIPDAETAFWNVVSRDETGAMLAAWQAAIRAAKEGN